MEFNPWLDACSFGQGHGIFTDDASSIALEERQSSLKDTSLPRSSAPAQWQTDVVSSTTDIWRNDSDSDGIGIGGGGTAGAYSTLPDSWSQTLDSLLGSTLDGTNTSPRYSPETSSHASSSGDSARLFSSAASTASSSGPSRTSPGPYTLSLSPSDPFDILPSEARSPTHTAGSKYPGPDPTILTETSDSFAAKPQAIPGLAFSYPTPTSTSTSLPNSSSPTHTPISYLTSASTSAAGPAFRLLLPGQPPSSSPPHPLSGGASSMTQTQVQTQTQMQAQVQATCVSPADLALHRLPAPAPKHHTIPAGGGGGHGSVTAGSVSLQSVSLSNTSGYYPNPTTRNVSGGLSGWTPSQSLPTHALTPTPTAVPSSRAGLVAVADSTRTSYALASAIVPGLKPPCPRPSAGRLSLPSSSHASAPNNNNNAWPSSRSSLPNLPATRTATSAEAEATVAARRTRRRTARRLRYSLGSDDDEEGGEQDDDDDSEDAYQPSTSSSPERDVAGGSNSREGSPYSYPRFGLTAGVTSSSSSYHATGATGYSGRNGGGGVIAERTTRRGRGKAKGSAALALAVVTQMSRMQQQQASGSATSSSLLSDSLLQNTSTSSLLYHNQLSGDIAIGPDLNDDGVGGGRIGGDLLDGHRGPRKRKNSSIPLPVPVPHLIKKSRGRKVPYVAPLDGPLSLEGEIGGGGGSPTSSTTSSFAQSSFPPSSSLHPLSSYSSSLPSSSSAPLGRPHPSRTATTTSTRGGARKTSTTPTAYSLAEGGKRTYMCEVPGCGKCFVRGEHLKRHVRSIHTWDKPHPCPYNGCDKTFSRRDNLGQHVRVHLQV